MSGVLTQCLPCITHLSIKASVQKRKDRSSGYALSVIVVLNSDEEGGGGEMTVVVEGTQMRQRQRRGRQSKT